MQGFAFIMVQGGAILGTERGPPRLQGWAFLGCSKYPHILQGGAFKGYREGPSSQGLRSSERLPCTERGRFREGLQEGGPRREIQAGRSREEGPEEGRVI